MSCAHYISCTCFTYFLTLSLLRQPLHNPIRVGSGGLFYGRGGAGGGISSGTPKSDNVIYIQPRGTLFCGFFPLRGYCISSFNSLLFLIYFHKVRLNERLMLVVWELAVIMHNLRIYPKPPSLSVKMVKRMARTESMTTRCRR